MSRSYKKIGLYRSDRRGSKRSRTYANKRVRKYLKNIDNEFSKGKNYKKYNDSWEIIDYKSFCYEYPSEIKYFYQYRGIPLTRSKLIDIIHNADSSNSDLSYYIHALMK